MVLLLLILVLVQNSTVVAPAVMLHDWSCEKIVPSVTGEFNIGESVGDSLFSGGVDGRGFHTVALHDGTFQHSTGYDHCASILSYLYDAIR
jgi:hypothetical protein